jgi:hypothetical protein
MMFVHHKATSHRLYQLKLGILHITLTILQSKGVHIQVALGTDPTYTLPGIELTAGLTTWNRKEGPGA